MLNAFFLIFPEKKNKKSLVAYADWDWGGDLITRKSTSGFACFYEGCLISWKSKRQSSMEGEIYALVDATQELLFLRKLLLEVRITTTIKLFEDNQGAIAFIKNNSTHGRSKHIDIKVFFIRDLVKDNTIEIMYTASQDNISDLFTKPLLGIKFAKFTNGLHLFRCNPLRGSVTP